MGGPAPTGGATGTGTTAGGANVWDVVRTLIVLGALVYLTVFLVRHYKDSKDVTSVLGVVVPVLAAVVGVTLGYASGNQAGEAKGQAGKEEAVKSARKGLMQEIAPVVERLAPATESLVDRIVTIGASDPGTGAFKLAADHLTQAGEVTIPQQELTGTREAVAHLRGIVRGVAAE